jgi:hypothetical protein
MKFEEKYRLMKLKEEAIDIENFCECVLDDEEHGVKYYATEKFDMEHLEGLRASAHKLVASINQILNEEES